MDTEWWAWDELDGGALKLDLGLHLASLLMVFLVELFISLNLSILICERTMEAP